MLNMIKMDLYRMFRTKSMYVVWIVLAVSVLFTTFMCKTDYDSLSKVSRQLNVSMGGMAYLLCGMAVIMFIVLIYLLTKTIIEKNAQSISMTKILGYTNHEVSSIYIVSTSIIVSLFILLTVPLDYVILKPIFEAMMKEEMAGWMPLTVSNLTFLKTIVIGFITVSYTHLRAHET